MAVIKLSSSITMKIKYLLPPNKTRKHYAYRRPITVDLRIFYEDKANHWHLIGTELNKATREAEKLSRQYDREYVLYRGSDTDELKAIKESAEYNLKFAPQKKVTYTIVDAGKTIEFLDNHPDYDRWLEDMSDQYEYHEKTANGYERYFSDPEPYHQLMLDTFQGKRKHSLKQVEEFSLSTISSTRKQTEVRARFKEFTPFTDPSHIKKIKKAHFRAYIKHLDGKGLSSKSIKVYVHRLIGLLRAYWKANTSGDNHAPNWSWGLVFPVDKSDEEEQVSSVITPKHMQEIETAAIKKMQRFLTQQLVAIQMNTGCRISEIAGLRVKDVYLDEPIPYINIVSHKARKIKTKGSRRLIPLVGLSLDAIRFALDGKQSEQYLFPTLIKTSDQGEEVSNSASSIVNKWLKNNFDTRYTSHSFRHTLTARAKISGYSALDLNELLGWSSKANEMFDRYGAISNLSRTKDILEKVASIKEYPVF